MKYKYALTLEQKRAYLTSKGYDALNRDEEWVESMWGFYHPEKKETGGREWASWAGTNRRKTHGGKW